MSHRDQAELLDELLDGRARPGDGIPADVAELLAVADALAADIGRAELDPGLAHRHLRLALQRPVPRLAPVPVRTRVRRRVAVIGLAAALLAVPAAVASASSLPGDPLYRVKLATDKVRLLAARSPEAEAATRVELAGDRLADLDALLAAGKAGRVPAGVEHLRAAVAAAEAAIAVARAEGADSTRLAALETTLREIVTRANALLAGAPPTAPRPGAAGPASTAAPGTTTVPGRSPATATATATANLAASIRTTPPAAAPGAPGPTTAEEAAKAERTAERERRKAERKAAKGKDGKKDEKQRDKGKKKAKKKDMDGKKSDGKKQDKDRKNRDD
jgi:hypothetical protein